MMDLRNSLIEDLLDFSGPRDNSPKLMPLNKMDY
jgi:hypothetical protein